MSKLQIAPGSPSVAAGSIIGIQRWAVESKLNWSDPWVRRPYVEPAPSGGTDCAAPSIGFMNFIFNYGKILREKKSSFLQEYDIEQLDYFIRIVNLNRNGSPIWTGIVAGEDITPGGANPIGGDEGFAAFGLCQLLDREEIRTAKALDGNGTIVDVQKLPTVNLKMDLNTTGGARSNRSQKWGNAADVFGNRSTSKHSDGAYVFSSEGNQWSNLDWAEAILARYAPVNGPTFQLGGQKSVLDQFHGVFEIAGKTPWVCLNELISRRRGVGFCPIVIGNVVVLYVFTLAESDFSIGDVVIPANSNRISVNLDSSIDIDRPNIVWNAATLFDRIEVRGQPMLSCFTISYPDGTLQKRWSDAIETKYKNGAADAATYATDPDTGVARTSASKATMNDDYRRDDRFCDVYVKHGIPSTWDGLVGDGQGGGKLPSLPSCSDSGDVVVFSGTPFLPMGKAFEAFLPMEEGADYGVNPVDRSAQAAGAEPTFKKPFALIKNPTSQRWYYVEKSSVDLAGSEAHFALHPREMSIAVEASNRYIYGLNSFDPNTVEPCNDVPVFDYRNLMVTIALRTDQVVRMAVLRDGLNPATDKIRTKVIDVPHAELWYIAPNTVVGVNPDLSPRYYQGNSYLRDDRDRLREVLAAGCSWYGAPRAAVTIPVKRLDAIAPLGALITATMTGGFVRAINTPVTSIQYRFGDSPAHTVQTQFGEIDLSQED